MKAVFARLVRRVLPGALYRAWRRRQGRPVTPPVGRVAFGDLRRTDPITRDWGYKRGVPVDRYYIERFLERHRADVRGRVLEAGDDAYTRRFGGAAVRRSDVLHVKPDAPRATIVGDLADETCLPERAFDCIVLTQTLHLVFDPHAAMRHLDRALRPGGVLLLSVPGISPIDAGEWGSSWYYAFTHHALRRMADEFLHADEVEVVSHGNALAAVAFLHGLAAEELEPVELSRREETHAIVHTLRARRRTGPSRR